MYDAIADALLAGPWTRPRMVARIRRVIDQPGPWIDDLVRHVLLAYPRAPRDAPRELARFVALAPPLRTALETAREAGAPLPRVVRRIAVETRMARRRWPVPQWNHVTDLANHLGLTLGELQWFADVQRRELRVADERLRHYRYHWRDGRLLEAPKWQLREIQRRLLHEALDRVPPHDAACGFRRGRSVCDYAAPHVGQRIVVHLDLEHFFASISAGRIWGIFRMMGYAEPVATVLTGLTTNAVPFQARRAAPPRLRQWLAASHLPQGAPTSPALANLATYRLDNRLAGLARACGAAYTRYADDIALSGPSWLGSALPEQVAAIAEGEGFRVNAAKTSAVRRNGRQRLGGIVVNDRLGVSRREYDLLKATLHNCVRFRPASQNRHGHRDFQAHLLGRVSWVASVHPQRGAALRALAGRIDWAAPASD